MEDEYELIQFHFIMENNINLIDSSVSSLDFRLDILRLTFLIEERVENMILNSFDNKFISSNV